jgi:hypothetical protein
MGGKSGGGGVSWTPQQWAKMVYDQDAATKQNSPEIWQEQQASGGGLGSQAQFESTRANYHNPTTGAWDEAAWKAAKGGATSDYTKALYDLYYPDTPAPAPAAAAVTPDAAAPAPTPDPTPTPTPTPDPTPTPTGPPSSQGAAITQPSSANNPTPSGTGGVGDAMGGAVLSPPKYWVGGVDRYNTSNPTTGRGGGRVKTTQT